MKKQRTTQQRKVIEEICFSSTHPLSIDDIEARGKKRLHTLNRVTIYRNLNRMVDAGELLASYTCERRSTNKPTALIIIISIAKPVKPHLNSPVAGCP